MRLFFLTILTLFVATTVSAQTTIITDTGMISMRGKIESVGFNNFTIMSNDERVTVSMENLKDDATDNLMKSGIIKRGSFVEITGKLSDTVSGSEIEADVIQLYQ